MPDFQSAKVGGGGGRRSKAYLRVLRGSVQVRYLHAGRSFLGFPERMIGDSHLGEARRGDLCMVSAVMSAR
jgi:hypothetical protein